MSDISKIPVSQLREAAMAWREASMPRGWLDEMIAEIERLRAALAGAEKP